MMMSDLLVADRKSCQCAHPFESSLEVPRSGHYARYQSSGLGLVHGGLLLSMFSSIIYCVETRNSRTRNWNDSELNMYASPE